MNVSKNNKDKGGRGGKGGNGGKGGARRTQAQRTEATRSALLAAARRLFAERGYEAVAAEEIVRAGGVTRGALYHHFGGKAELLDAVYEQLEREVTERIARVVLGSELESPLEAMRAGVGAFLEECAKPEVRQIVLHDAPAVLGWERWREIAAANGLGLIEASLAAAIEAGELRPLPVRPTAHLLLGALDEAAMLVSRSDDPVARAEATAVLWALLDGLALPRPA
jgi:AcrR family transcriptional regulator